MLIKSQADSAHFLLLEMVDLPSLLEHNQDQQQLRSLLRLAA